MPCSHSPAVRCGCARKLHSHAETAYGLPGSAPIGEHGRAGSDRDRVPARLRVGEEHERAGGRVDLVAVDREARVAGEHDVELLVAARGSRGLRVLLDHILPGGRRRVGVDAEGAHAERVAQRMPEQRAADRRDRLELG